jgi:hypothetical protein
MIAALRVACCLLAGSCTIDDRKLTQAGPGSEATQSSMSDAASSQTPPGREGLDEGASGGDSLDQEGLPAVGGLQPVDGVSGGANASCRGDADFCASASDAGSSVPCVATGPRDCTSDLDNDCDGRADNTADDVCACTPESVEPCDEHPGLDGRGQCRQGSRTCVAGEGNLTSSWGACTGAVGPGEQDSCTVQGDDTDCDGTNNGGCPCIEGEARPCGPATENGICQLGTQTCASAVFGQCVSAVFPAARNCGSEQDNDCDGRPDNTLDNVCTCAIGSVQACAAHPGNDGNGQCKAGSQTCEGRAANSTSAFGACAGSVGPAPQDTCAQGNDSNCNGLTNEGCACINGNTRPCGPDTDIGACQRGAQTCVNGAFGQCQGAVFPAARNCESQQDNDCDGRPDNTIDNVCECVPGQGNAPCSADANNSRCDGQGQCVACQTNGDCSLVSGGRNSCDGGRCVVNLLADGARCQSANECASGSCPSWARDADRDGFGRQNTSISTCGAAAPPNPPGAPLDEVWVSVPNGGAENERFDCCDTDGNAKPSQTDFQPGARNECAGPPGDFNCDGREDRRFEGLAGNPLEVLSGFQTCEDLGTDCTSIRLIWIGGEPPPCGTPPGVAGASQCLLVDGQGQCQSISGVGIAPFCL